MLLEDALSRSVGAGQDGIPREPVRYETSEDARGSSGYLRLGSRFSPVSCSRWKQSAAASCASPYDAGQCGDIQQGLNLSVQHPPDSFEQGRLDAEFCR